MPSKIALSSKALIRPATVYVMQAPESRPGFCKIGRAFEPGRRVKSGSTWLPDLAVFFEAAFLDGTLAETAAHQRFKEHLFVDGAGQEWFKVAPGAVKSYLQELQAAQEQVRAEFETQVRKALELGLIQGAMPCGMNTALEAVLNWKLPRQGLTAFQAARTALSSSPAAAPAIFALERAGMTPHIQEGVVIVNLAPGSALAKHLDKVVGANRWQPLLEDFAGFSKTGESVKMSEWILRQSQKAHARQL